MLPLWPDPIPQSHVDACAMLADGRWEDAHRAFAELDHPLARWASALALERLGRDDDAWATLSTLGSEPVEQARAQLSRASIASRGGRRAEALEAARAFAELVGDAPIATQLVDSLGGGRFVAPLQREVVDLFDGYADRFDDHLVHDLGYVGHRHLPAALGEARSERGGVVIDLGCGTGLCGEGLREVADRSVGVDLSPAMVGRARATGHYAAVWTAELVYALATTPPSSVEGIVAADVLGYIGDLSATFTEAARVLRTDGAFALTVEAGRHHPFRMHGARRVAYTRRYLIETAERAGLQIVRLDEAALRREAGAGVDAFLVVCRG